MKPCEGFIRNNRYMVTVTLKRECYEELSRQAKDEDVPMTVIIRRALARELERGEAR